MKISALVIDINSGQKDRYQFVLRGRLDNQTVARHWKKIHQMLHRDKPQALGIDAQQVDYCDGAGICFLLSLEEAQKKAGGIFQITGLKPQFERMLHNTVYQPKAQTAANRSLSCWCDVENLGRCSVDILKDMHDIISYVGEMVVALARVCVNPRRLRWGDTWWTIEMAGVRALGIIALVSLLLGLILAFQSAIPLERFGAQIFVADLVAISVTRELGPLMTAIILAGRTGSAFAAELGTMKVNEELNALKTMGLDATSFLIAPRVLATIFITPLLTVFSIMFALLGAGIVMLSLDFTLVSFINQVQGAVALKDVYSGLFKSVVFGLLVAAIGCLRGLETGIGAQAVGISATRAVVSGIFLILLADGLFAVLFYLLGI